MAIPKKPRQCRVCKTMFQPVRCLQTVCSPECAIEQAKAKRAKDERIAVMESRKVIRLQKEKLKSRSEWMKEAQIVFNQYIRERDKNLPCISCGRHHQGQYHAGHYRTVGSHPELRFEESNAHKQCSVCNNHKSGNIIEYRINLKAKIGNEKLEWLEGNHDSKKYSIDDLKDIKSIYKSKLKELQRG